MRCAPVLLLLSISLAAQQPAAHTGTILNIYDAFGLQKEGTVLDWGFSVLIDYNGKKILFDTGNNAEKFAHNVVALHVDLQKVDFAVLSHRHGDHATGFSHLMSVNPRVKGYLPDDPVLGSPIGSKFDPKEMEGLAKEERYYGGATTVPMTPGSFFNGKNVEYIHESREIAPGIVLIRTVSKLMGDFSAYPPAEEGHPDFEGFPELSLALKTSRGWVLITGCSHSKVETIVEATKQFTHGDIALLEGGFHWLPYDTTFVEKMTKQLKDDLGVKRVAPAHCTGHIGFQVLRRAYGNAYSYAGVESVVSFPL